jgi:anti-sigma factor RsiW
MNCSEVRIHLLDRRRDAVPADLRRMLDAHLEACEDCRREDAADAELTRILDRHLPRRAAPASLKRALQGPTSEGLGRATRARSRGPVWGLSGAVGGAALTALVLVGARSLSANDAMLSEAVNDHLRVLYREQPVEVEGPDTHKVKPWFLGRLDFAPVIAFGGDDEFPLKGGSVSYFLDRKAATLVFGRRLHVITLHIFRQEGLTWPTVGLRPIGHARAAVTGSRGFHALLWRDGDLGYALVSDVDERELTALGAKIAGP